MLIIDARSSNVSEVGYRPIQSRVVRTHCGFPVRLWQFAHYQSVAWAATRGTTSASGPNFGEKLAGGEVNPGANGSNQDDDEPLAVLRALANRVLSKRNRYNTLDSIQYDPNFPKCYIIDGRSKCISIVHKIEEWIKGDIDTE